jgi:hypothetical protein
MKTIKKKESVGFPTKGGKKNPPKAMAAGTATVHTTGSKATFSGGKKKVSKG